jgi:hypothetical protein
MLRRNKRGLLFASVILLLTFCLIVADWTQITSFLSARLAEAALEKLVLQPPPWTDGEQMQLDAKGQEATSLTRMTFTVRAGVTNGQRIWRLMFDATGSERVHHLVEVEADTFKPIHSHYETGTEVAEITYKAGLAVCEGPHQNQVRKSKHVGPVFDNDEYFQLLRRLPLKPGYKIRLPMLSPSQRGIIVWPEEVSGLETVTVPAGTFQCFAIKRDRNGQAYWYSTDPHHYLVKIEVGTTVYELSTVRH